MWHTEIMFIFVSMFLIFLKMLTSTSNAVKYHFNFFIFYFVTGLVTGIMCPLFLFRPRDVRNANLCTAIIVYIIGKIYDVQWVLRNREILAEERGAVIVSNHQSSLDILGMFTIWDDVGRMAVIAKKQLFYLFPFGLSAYLAGVVFIDRKNSTDAYKQLKDTSEVMVNNKTKIWLFPEGTRNKDYTKLLPFKKGAFNIAVAAQVPIIPVVFSPYYFINPQKYIFGKGMCTIWDDVGKIAVIAKKQLFYLFPFGLSAYLAGVVFIDRNNSKYAYKQLKDTSNAMINNKTKIWMCPEGTRNKDYTKLLPFKKGAFNIAVAAQVPIIPVVFSPYYFINPQKYIFGKGHIIIQALEPIPTVGLTKDNVPDLIAKIHEMMSTTYKNMSKEVLSNLPDN